MSGKKSKKESATLNSDFATGMKAEKTRIVVFYGFDIHPPHDA